MNVIYNAVSIFLQKRIQNRVSYFMMKRLLENDALF